MQPDRGAAVADGGLVAPAEGEGLAAAQLRRDDHLEVREQAVVEVDHDVESYVSLPMAHLPPLATLAEKPRLVKRRQLRECKRA